MKKQTCVDVQTSNGISRIQINEPHTYNALSFNTLNLLVQAFEKFNKDQITKVIIIEGLGRGFSAGHNLKEIRSLKKKIKI